MSKKIGTIKIYGDIGKNIHLKTLHALMASATENPSLYKELQPIIEKLSKSLSAYDKSEK